MYLDRVNTRVILEHLFLLKHMSVGSIVMVAVIRVGNVITSNGNGADNLFFKFVVKKADWEVIHPYLMFR